MGVHNTNSRFPIKQLLQFSSFPEILLHQEMTSFHLMTNIKIISKFRELYVDLDISKVKRLAVKFAILTFAKMWKMSDR